MTASTDPTIYVTAGADTHRDTHMIAALDQRGAQLGVREFATDPTGHDDILEWLESFGTIDRIGVEGTGTYGAGLCRFLQRHDIDVVEVTRGDRQERRSHGKSDPVDAVAAARAAESGKAVARPKSRTGSVEAIRALRLVRRSATRDRTGAINQMRALIVTAPDEIREAFRGVTIHQLVTRAARLRPADPTTAAGATKFALRDSPAASKRSTPRSHASTPSSARSSRRPHPASSHVTESAPTPPPHCSSPPATTPTGCAAKRRSRTSAAAHRSTPHPGLSNASGSTRVGIGAPTKRSGASSSCACPPTPEPAPTSPAAPSKARANERSCAA